MGVDTENRLPSLKRMHIVGDTGYTYTESAVACGDITYARLIYYALYRSFFTYLKCFHMKEPAGIVDPTHSYSISYITVVILLH